MNLIIVESPTKARTLGRFLGNGYTVEASFGHVRDLPQKKLGINLEKNFEPDYVQTDKQKKKVEELKKLGDGAEKIYLATDPDREERPLPGM
jgi:DNA topoisomerase-1